MVTGPYVVHVNPDGACLSLAARRAPSSCT